MVMRTQVGGESTLIEDEKARTEAYAAVLHAIEKATRHALSPGNEMSIECINLEKAKLDQMPTFLAASKIFYGSQNISLNLRDVIWMYSNS